MSAFFQQFASEPPKLLAFTFIGMGVSIAVVAVVTAEVVKALYRTAVGWRDILGGIKEWWQS